MDKQRLISESIVLLSADIYQDIYGKTGCWGDAVDEIIRLAEMFEDELGWEDDDERDYLLELEKFEKRVLSEIGK